MNRWISEQIAEVLLVSTLQIPGPGVAKRLPASVYLSPTCQPPNTVVEGDCAFEGGMFLYRQSEASEGGSVSLPTQALRLEGAA